MYLWDEIYGVARQYLLYKEIPAYTKSAQASSECLGIGAEEPFGNDAALYCNILARVRSQPLVTVLLKQIILRNKQASTFHSNPLQNHNLRSPLAHSVESRLRTNAIMQ